MRNGKGDSQRPVDRDRFENNYDEIEWNGCKSDCKSCEKRCGNAQKKRVVCFSKQEQQESKSLCSCCEGEEASKDQGE